MELLKRLCESPGIPGREEEIAEIIKKELAPLCNKVYQDKLGNVIGVRNSSKSDSGKPLRVMISGHMDQIGFVVTHIDKQGFLFFHNVGGVDPRTLIAQRVTVHGKKNLAGVIGIKPIHLLTEEERKKPIQLKELFIDLGLDVDEVKELVDLGDPITLDQSMKIIGNTVCAHSLDDRVGIYVFIEALKKIKKEEVNVDIYAVASVQEEVGLRGAGVAAYGIKPDIGIALDVTPAVDVPEVKRHERCTSSGKGVALKILDSRSISDIRLVRFLRDLAKKYEIPFQFEVLPRGGTDAGAIQISRTGIPVVTLSVPTRYIHSVVEMAHKRDIEAAINLLSQFLLQAHTCLPQFGS
jgi:endoglucanase